MKNLIIYTLIIFAVASCKTKQVDKKLNIDTLVSVIKADSGNVKEDSHYFWTSELDSRLGLIMKKTFPVKNDSLNAGNMIQMLNKAYPEIRLEFIKVSNDSIFVRIRKSSYLTQQMGSSGADAYLAEMTYNLTELNGINYVDIRFPEGDHASPGVYSRTDFIRPRSAQ
jgi:hypothetical protein